MGDYQLKRKQATHRYNCPRSVRHATRFMAPITVGCTTQPTIGTSTRETGVASPTFEPSRCTTGSITMVGPLPGLSRVGFLNRGESKAKKKGARRDSLRRENKERFRSHQENI